LVSGTKGNVQRCSTPELSANRCDMQVLAQEPQPDKEAPPSKPGGQLSPELLHAV
jgi:hypothetical protein